MTEWMRRKEALEELAQCSQEIFDLVKKRSYLVRKARLRGASWSSIGLQLGTSRQGAYKRFKHLDTGTYLFPLPSAPDEPSAG
jgi:hypothetical protein